MSYHYPNDGVCCLFGKSDFCSKDWCAMWNDDGCLVRQALTKYVQGSNQILEAIDTSTNYILDAVGNGVHYG